MKRLSRYQALVPFNKSLTLNYTGTVPTLQYFQFQGASSKSDYVHVMYQYTTSQSIRVEFDNHSVAPPTAVGADGNDNLLTPSSTCGANVYTNIGNKIQFTLTGDPTCSLYVRITNSIFASARYNISVDDFYANDGKTKFIDRIAAVLGIPFSTIRVVSVKSGSTIIDFYVDSQHQNNSDSSTLSNAATELASIQSALNAAATNGGLNFAGVQMLNFTSSLMMAPIPANVSNSTNSTAPSPLIAAPVSNPKSSFLPIILGVIIPIVAILAIATVVIFYIKKKQSRKMTKVTPEINEKDITIKSQKAIVRLEKGQKAAFGNNILADTSVAFDKSAASIAPLSDNDHDINRHLHNTSPMYKGHHVTLAKIDSMTLPGKVISPTKGAEKDGYTQIIPMSTIEVI